MVYQYINQKPYFTSTLVVNVTSHESNPCSVFALQACLHANRFHVGSRQRDLPDTKDTDTEKVLLSCYVTTKVLVK